MRSKAPLALMEQMVMILVFALAAALCLQVFARADLMSRENQQRDDAVRLAQNAAEVYKACGGDASQAAGRLGGRVEQGVWSSYYDEELAPVTERKDAAYAVDVCPQPTQMAGLGQASVHVFAADGQGPLFQLTVAWQEEVALHD